ncbi:MAG: hypothetical protein TEF_20935 [Rhizobiales bacterium NRL2]|jgi:hypothetical protein|nr:MAG: hypothetical protein TEF_20935 [Rhizobiales bacterium NRL2]
MTEMLLAIVLGAAFGATLDRIGATNPGYIIRMLNLTETHLMKTIFTGIGVASVLLFGGLLLGVVDPGHLSVKSAYAGVFIGGLLLGAGFAVAGYCPGTGLTALATGRKDALFFAIGGLCGAAAYMVSYEDFAGSAMLADIAGGKTTLGLIEGAGYPALFESLSGEIVGIVIGVVFIAIGLLLPHRLAGKPRSIAAE